MYICDEYMYVHIYNVYICMCIYMHIWPLLVLSKSLERNRYYYKWMLMDLNVYVINICMYVCIYVYINAYVHI
jgi:hypothetical protein